MDAVFEKWINQDVNRYIVVNYMFATNRLDINIANIVNEYSAIHFDELDEIDKEIDYRQLFDFYKQQTQDNQLNLEQFSDLITSRFDKEYQSFWQEFLNEDDDNNTTSKTLFNENYELLNYLNVNFDNQKIQLVNYNGIITNKDELYQTLLNQKQYLKYNKFIYKTHKKLLKNLELDKKFSLFYKELYDCEKLVMKKLDQLDEVNSFIIYLQLVNFFNSFYVDIFYDRTDIVKTSHEYKDYINLNDLPIDEDY